MTTPVPEPSDLCWPVDTSCIADWDAVEGEGEDAVPVYTDEQKARAVMLAAMTMRMLTGYRVGGCPITVRPCRSGCSEDTWRSYPVGCGSTPWHPVSFHGTWLNVYCGHLTPCGCNGVDAVELYAPAAAVTEVKVDGQVVSSASYTLEAGGVLRRVDGQQWPLCQDLNAPDTEEGTWSVTYTPGFPVDAVGAFAAGKLAGQYVQACSGGQCDLPRGVSQVVRNGVTLTLTPGSFPGGLTGIVETDAYIRRWNPYGLVGPSMVMSPDLHRPRITGGPA